MVRQVVKVIALDQCRQRFSTRVILLYLPIYRIDKEPQNLDTVSFFMELHRG